MSSNPQEVVPLEKAGDGMDGNAGEPAAPDNSGLHDGTSAENVGGGSGEPAAPDDKDSQNDAALGGIGDDAGEPTAPDDGDSQNGPRGRTPEPDNGARREKYPSKMIAALVVAVAAAAFLAGYNTDVLTGQDGLSDAQMNLILSEIRSAAPPQQGEAPATAATVSPDDDPLKGSPDAPVMIIEFSDFECPFCKRFYHQTLPLIEQNYIDTGKAVLVYRDFPLANHQNAVPTHVAAECADEQGAFWRYHDVLFETQGEWAPMPPDAISMQLSEYARDMGLDVGAFDSCMGSGALEAEVQKDYQDGIAAGVTGTPTFFIGSAEDGFVLVSGAQPYGTFQNVIESKLDRIAQ